MEELGEPPIESALSILVNSLEREADLHPLGRFLMRTHLRELIETRLRLDSRVEWAIGDLRSLAHSTARVHHRHAAKRFHFSPRITGGRPRKPRTAGLGGDVSDSHWKQASKKVDPRVRKAEASLWWFRRLAPGADSVYPMRAWTPHECVAIHSYTLMSEEFVSTGHIPTYEAFLHTADLGPVYRWQKRFLQYLQLGLSEQALGSKSPDHMYGLDTLLTVFPDAAIIQTHRNPVDVLNHRFN